MIRYMVAITTAFVLVAPAAIVVDGFSMSTKVLSNLHHTSIDGGKLQPSSMGLEMRFQHNKVDSRDVARSTCVLSMSSMENKSISVRTSSFGNNIFATTVLVLAFLLGPNIIGRFDHALAVDTTISSVSTLKEAATVFNHNYDDPSFPNCRRSIGVIPGSFLSGNEDDSTTLPTIKYTYSGTKSKNENGNRGCTSEERKEFGIQAETYQGNIEFRKSSTSSIPTIFLPDGREGIFQAGLLSSNENGDETTSEGIEWNDGTKWIVSSSSSNPIGEFVVYSYIGLSGLAGVKGVFDAVQRKKEETNEE